MVKAFSFTIEEQFKISIISLGGMMILMILTTIYLAGWVANTWYFRLLIIGNSFFGFLFLLSMFVTSYQQYQTYKAMSGIQDIAKMVGGIIPEMEQMKGGKT